MDIDFDLHNHGSIVILFAVSEAARNWVDENLPDDALNWGTNGTVIEPRYVPNILLGIADDGLSVRAD